MAELSRLELTANPSVQAVSKSIYYHLPSCRPKSPSMEFLQLEARAGDNIVSGGADRAGTTGMSGSDGGVRIGSQITDKESTGEVFEKVTGIVRDSVLSSDNNGDEYKKPNPNTGTITPAPIPASAITNANALASLQPDDIHNRYLAQTPSFDAMNTNSQASCLCYGTTSGAINYQPHSYRSLMSSCYNHVNVEASQSAAAAVVSDQAGLFASAPDVRQSAADGVVGFRDGE
ncbi:MAG: hypothetical protein LQ337_006409 [Flavoplaca oasis]|nr:MAG: hypothetical protein LQ337_006409 [Flavoplaca oasis]